jgi:hypothetical protein
MRGNEPPGLDGRTLLVTVLEEQEARWDRGERPTVEDYLAGHPSLRADAEAAVVIYQEYVIRRRLGEPVRADDYVRRFPEWTDTLIEQFAVDEAMRPVEALTVLPSDGVPPAGDPAPSAAEGERPAPLAAISRHKDRHKDRQCFPAKGIRTGNASQRRGPAAARTSVWKTA